MKTLKELYSPKAGVEDKFVKLHKIMKFSDKVGDDPNIYNGGSKPEDKSIKKNPNTDQTDTVQKNDEVIKTVPAYDGGATARTFESFLGDEEEPLLEKLKPSMGVGKYISDFDKSDDPRFKGKSKKERTKMALGAWYGAKKGKSKKD